MFTPNNQVSSQPVVAPIEDSLALMLVDEINPHVNATNDVQNGGFPKGEFFVCNSKKLQDDLKILGLKIKHYEDNLKSLMNKKNYVNESILDVQVVLGKYHSSSVPMPKTEDNPLLHDEEKMIEQIQRNDKSAACILWQMKARHFSQTSHFPWIKDVLGIVVSLGKVDDDNLSRLFSEYLGVQNMLAIVCKTFECVEALETYDNENCINKSSGLHELGATIGRQLEGRFLVICLENLRPYSGEFLANDPQKRLDLLKPRLPNGECPHGFLGFAVNMINLENNHLFCVTSSGYGLRETLLYHLFSRLQVYKSRNDMLLALPLISDGALSLDGGMIRQNGMFSLGHREDLDVKFAVCSGMSNLPVNYDEIEYKLREKRWEKERLQEDIRLQQAVLDQAKFSFDLKKQEFIKFLTESSAHLTQVIV